MLLGGDVGHGVEDVGVVECSLRNRPVLHSGGHDSGNREVELAAHLNGFLEGLEDVLRQASLHFT